MHSRQIVGAETNVEEELGRVMAENPPRTYVFNRTRQAFLAHDLVVADNHWLRLKGLLGTKEAAFSYGKGLWIVPCHGVHTVAMRFAIDVVYLDEQQVVVHVEENVRPWRVTPVRMDTATVLELPSHTIFNTGTQVGDQIEISQLTGQVGDEAEITHLQTTKN